MGSALNLSVPSIGKEFEIGAAQVTWVVTAYMLACTALPVPFGKLADLMQRKWILTAGLGVFTAGSAGGSLAPSMGWLLFFRLLQGAGTAMIYSTSMSVLVSAAPDAERSRMLGYSTAATYLGLSAGPAAGGLLTQQLGWRWIFAATAGVSAVAFFCAVRWVLEKKSEPERNPQSAKFDTGLSGKVFPSGISSLLYVCTVSVFIFGLSAAASGMWGWLLSAAGVCGLIYYVWREYRIGNPLLPVKWMRKRPDFLCFCLASLINYGTNFVLNYQLAVYMQICMGYSSQKAGLILVISPAVQAVLSVFVGKAAGKRISHRILSAAGMLGTAAVAAGFGLLQQNTPLWAVCAGLAGAGLACALFASPNTSQVFAAAGQERYSMASAVLSTMRSMGHTLCMAAASVITGIYIGDAKLETAEPEQMLQIMNVTFFLLAGLCIIGFFMALKKKV